MLGINIEWCYQIWKALLHIQMKNYLVSLLFKMMNSDVLRIFKCKMISLFWYSCRYLGVEIIIIF